MIYFREEKQALADYYGRTIEDIDKLPTFTWMTLWDKLKEKQNGASN